MSTAIPTVMPWRHAGTICGAALVLGVAGFVMQGSAGSMAATAGFAVGLFATLSAGGRGALVSGAGYLAAAALLLAFPNVAVLLALCLALSAASAVEVLKAGSRMSIMVLMGFILFAIAARRGGDVWMLPLAAAGLVVGWWATAHLRLSGVLRLPLASRHDAIRLGLFLGLGVVLSVGMAYWIELPHAYWIVILFLSRSLMPMQQHPGALLKYGHGAALGVVAAVVVEALGTPDALRLLLALAAFVPGLRYMIHPLPISAAAMTAGVLLASAPTPGDAGFRAGAIVLVIGLILFLTLVLERVMPKLAEPTPSVPVRDESQDSGAGKAAAE